MHFNNHGHYFVETYRTYDFNIVEEDYILPTRP